MVAGSTGTSCVPCEGEARKLGITQLVAPQLHSSPATGPPATVGAPAEVAVLLVVALGCALDPNRRLSLAGARGAAAYKQSWPWETGAEC